MAETQTVLPHAQQRIFEKMGREFDNRDYTKALRSADSILSIAPDHADTIAMKGLTLHNLERKEEGFELIRKAISLHPTSTIAWHSLGMCRRNDKDFPGALKAFKQALVTENTNTNVLRDVSSASVQVRDWDGFLETREKMVTLKSSVRANWIALSCAHRTVGNVKLAAAVMDVMADIMNVGENPVEVSESHLYHVELALESGAPQRAIELLKRHDAEIKDAQTKLQLRARASMQLGQKAEAEKRYMELIRMGIAEADCIAAIAGLRKISLDSLLRPRSDVERYMELIEQVLEACPRSDYAKRHALDCVPLDQFKERLAAYASVFICRLIPSLFSVLKSLYENPSRAALVGEVFLQWEKELVAGDFASFGGDAAHHNPCFILWVHTFLATHYRRMGDYATAHAYIDKAIRHTPTLELLYLEKAKIYQREGKTAEAAERADFARQLDLQDKYMNSKAAKYYFRANDVAKGEEVMQLFYKPSTVPGDTFLTALESQCSWYEREVGEAFYRQGDYISALQNLLMFEFHHKQNHDELSDFHNYVFRRNTMRAWFNVIDCDDCMGKNKFFLKFCPAVVRTYMCIHVAGEEAARAAHVPRAEFVFDGVAADEVKRLKQLREEYYIDAETLDLSDPLGKARRYMEDLLAHRGHLASTHTLAVEYYTMLGKPLLVARALHVLHAKLHHAGAAELVSNFETGLYAVTSAKMDKRAKAIVDELLQLANK